MTHDVSTTVAAAHAQDPSEAFDPVFAPFAHDWDWLYGSWSVRHRRLRERLAGCADWDEFAGTSTCWPLMGGRGTADDNILDLPSGRYRAAGVRAFDVQTRQWAIWWIDSRTPGIEPPVRGGFADGIGTFIGDDTFNGQPIKVRFRWSEITPRSAHWDQAFSTDGGATWEANWHMDFIRTG
jgi:hypothetical protein